MRAKTFSPKVCIIGAGFSGICAAVKLQSELDVTSFTIFDKNAKVGGVWASHCYPGCCSETISVAYSFTFEPKLDWTKALAEADEIQTYAEFVCSKYNLWPHIQLETEVSKLVWNENEKNWTATIKYLKPTEFRVEEQVFDFVFLGTGSLRVPNIPEEFNRFEGLVMHTAQWNPSVTVDSLKDKNIGIVGTGDSGTQLAGTLGSKPYLHRSSFFTYIFFRVFSLLYMLFYFTIKSGSWFGAFMAYLSEKHMNSIIPPERSALRKALKPNAEFLSRLPGSEFGYYKSLLLPNVTLHTDPIVEVQANGLVTLNQGNVKESQSLDVLILATGYKTDEYFGPLKIFGRNGKDILQLWKLDRPMSYFGVLSSDMPNLFIIYGVPPVNTTHINIETQVNYAIRLLKLLRNKNKRSIVVKPTSESAYQREVERISQQLAFTKCRSYLVNSRGHPVFISPVSPPYYYFKLGFVNPSDFVFT